MSTTTPAPAVRVYEAAAESTPTFGRVAVAVRHHTLTVDGPVQNGAPGESPTPGELVLAAVAGCCAEVLQVLARDAGVALSGVAVTARGTIDRADQPHADVTVFTSVELTVRLRGPDEAQAAALVAGFRRRCPVYGSLAVASGRVDVRHTTESADADIR